MDIVCTYILQFVCALKNKDCYSEDIFIIGLRTLLCSGHQKLLEN